MKRGHQKIYGGGGNSVEYGSSSDGSSSMSSGKMKMWDDEEESETTRMDELLAVLGYKVRSSDMAKVAQKLEQLEVAMGSAQEDGISQLASDTVHYDPSDMSSWVQSMLSDLAPAESSTTLTTTVDNSEYDLRAIPGVAAYPQSELTLTTETSRKRLKPSIGSPSSVHLPPSDLSPPSAVACGSATRPVVLVETQENGVRLVHSLLACAEAVQQGNVTLADNLVKHIGSLTATQVGAMKKVATFFAEALSRRIYRLYPAQEFANSSNSDLLEMHFYESSPYLKFAHFTANQALLEAFATASSVHVIDFGLKQGMQWPALIQALALRPGGPPAFRLTGIGPPQPDNTDALQEVGWKLAQLAETIGVKFEFRGYVCNSLSDVTPSMLEIRPDVETVAVNSVFELHRLLARPGAIEKVLNSIKSLNPKIVTVVEQEANHNGPVFLDRFTESLHYYSTLFDSLEGSVSGLNPTNPDAVMSELYLGKQILNVVACEGQERVERHETLDQWRVRMESSGFNPVHLGSNAFKQASMLLALFSGGDDYIVQENNGCLMLGWHTRPLISTSAWRIAGNELSGLTQ